MALTIQSRQRGLLTRRRFLRGAGIALALPWMESSPLRAVETGKLSLPQTSTQPPVRFACLYFSNGVEPEHWWATGSGRSMKFGPGLAPMAPFGEDIVFLHGLFNAQAVANTSPHLGRMPNMLSGAWVSLDQNDIRVGKTMDQVLAQQIGPPHGDPQPGVGNRTDGTTAGRRSVHDLRLVYFLGHRDQAGDQGDLSGESV